VQGCSDSRADMGATYPRRGTSARRRHRPSGLSWILDNRGSGRPEQRRLRRAGSTGTTLTRSPLRATGPPKASPRRRTDRRQRAPRRTPDGSPRRPAPRQPSGLGSDRSRAAAIYSTEIAGLPPLYAPRARPWRCPRPGAPTGRQPRSSARWKTAYGSAVPPGWISRSLTNSTVTPAALISRPGLPGPAGRCAGPRCRPYVTDDLPHVSSHL
jgi:hypothetical protein